MIKAEDLAHAATGSDGKQALRATSADAAWSVCSIFSLARPRGRAFWGFMDSEERCKIEQDEKVEHVLKLLADIRDAINARYLREPAWGYVGELGYIIESLEEVKSFANGGTNDAN